MFLKQKLGYIYYHPIAQTNQSQSFKLISIYGERETVTMATLVQCIFIEDFH